jgi:beta-N-acetylhexosaminidase
MSHHRCARRSVLAAIVTICTVAVVPPAAAETTAEPSAGALAISTLHRMTLEEKVGQLFVTYVYGGDANTADQRNVAEYGVATPAEVVRKYHLGGAIYFAWSNPTNDLPQMARLSNGLQRAALGAKPKVPLLVSTDQEGGLVTRMGPPATAFPGNMALGAGRSDADARTTAKIIGSELKALGVNQNLAPVADVNVNPLNPVIGVRSFSADPALAARMTKAGVLGYERDAKISATPKHFPGHGDTETDSHTGIPVIHHSRQQWEQLDRPPFAAAIEAGTDTMMTAHIVVPALDPSEDPATLSRPIMTGILRQELGYDGVVITDSLGMQGVRDKYGDEEVPLRALEAGVDQLLMPPRMDLAYNSVLDAVKSGRISEQRIDQSVYRVLRLKYEKDLFDDPYVDPAKVDDRVGTPEHRAAAAQITDRTVTAVKNDDGVLPLSADPRKVLVTGFGVATTASLGRELADRGATPTVAQTGSRPTDAQIADAVAKAQANDLTVVLTMNASDLKVTDPEGQQQRLVKELLATGKPIVVVAVRNPYDIAHFTSAPTYLATYSYSPVAIASLAKVLYGEVSPRGKLPVEIPRVDDPSQPLYPFGHGLTW